MKKFEFLARPEPLVNDILSLKTSGSGDENGLVCSVFTKARGSQVTPMNVGSVFSSGQLQLQLRHLLRSEL